MRAISKSATLGVVIACGACATASPAPRRWLPPPAEAGADAFGAWIVVSTARVPAPLAGELLAVERDSIYVLGADGTVRSVPKDNVARARIAFYDAQHTRLAWWTWIGAISTISNGGFLIFTFPTWAIGGSLATRSQSRAPLIDVAGAHDWDSARMYARYPAGVPPDLPRTLPTRPVR